MKKSLLPFERLIVAADFRPNTSSGIMELYRKVHFLAVNLRGTRVYLKVGSPLRAVGFQIIRMIHDQDLKVVADLKLNDIGETLALDGMLLREARPEIVTVMCSTSVAGMKLLKAELPDTEVIGVTALTSLADVDTKAMFSCSTEEAVIRFAQIAADAKID